MNNPIKWKLERKVILFFALEIHMKKVSNHAKHVLVEFKIKESKSATGFRPFISEIFLFILLF